MVPYMARNAILVLLVVSFVHVCMGSRKLKSLVNPSPNLLKYHNGELLRGEIPISVLWYGQFKSAQKTIVSDFLLSLAPSESANLPPSPSVSQWWKTIDDTYLNKASPATTTRVILATQVSDENCSIGKSLKKNQIKELAGTLSPKKGVIALVITAEDVTVEGFCMSSCGTHGSINTGTNSPYIWIGNSASQCPGQCAWPFHQPIYGPQTAPLVAPNNNVGMDGVVMNLASLLAGTVTNPFGNGYFQGPKYAPLEAASACPGVYGKGAYPGYAGEVLKDLSTGASYNAHGVNGRRFLLPALFDPSSSSCSTLV